MTPQPLTIGLIGDYNPAILAHQAIPGALQLAARAHGVRLQPQWLATATLQAPESLRGIDGLWCVPGSPYRNGAAAMAAIGYARELGVPFLGTCGGFQHAVLDYARSVLGWRGAAHAETEPDAPLAVIAPLGCALVEARGALRLAPGSRLFAAYGVGEIEEGYHCSYGINPRLAAELTAGALHATAHDLQGEIRGVELDGHPFFVATLFQPERAALTGRSPPVVDAFVAAVCKACR
ncbi:MAG TPA: CTP synthase [Steroidobacteraceae bacterium]|nr:CTP synthase [Steroidobacteraceae bacterium]